jgi:hypothetical protein
MLQVAHRCVNEACSVNGYPLCWTATMAEDAGALFYCKEDDRLCPACQGEGEILRVMSHDERMF